MFESQKLFIIVCTERIAAHIIYRIVAASKAGHKGSDIF